VIEENQFPASETSQTQTLQMRNTFRKRMHRERLRQTLMESTRRKQLDPLHSQSILKFVRDQEKH